MSRHSHLKSHPHSSSLNRAFTLIELLVVIAIIGLLSSIILVSLSSAKEKAKNAVRQSDLNTLRTTLELYANDHNGAYPSTLTSGTTPDIYGLNSCSNYQGGTITGRTDWIPEVVTDSYIPTLPHDPDGLAANTATTDAGCTNNYLYASDGTDYTLSTGSLVFSTNPNATSTDNGNNGGNNGGNNNGGGNGGSGTASSTCTTTNCALQFDGSTNYVEVPYNSAFYPSTFTVECYVYMTSYPSAWGELIETRNESTGGSGFSLAVSTGGVVSFYADGLLGAWINTGSAIPLNSWNHIAVTYDGTTVTTWLNGVLQGYSGASGNLIDGGLPLTIATAADKALFFNGSVDEVRISSTARYTTTFTPATSFTSDGNTVALYKFNEGSGTTLTDSSNNGHAGTLQGNPTPTWVNGVTSSTGQNDGGQQNTSGHALQFDGSQNYLSVPSMSQFSGTKWTIEFWFKTTLNDTNMVISSDTDDSIRMGLKDQHPYFEFSFNAYDNSGNSHTYGTSYSGLAYNDGNWHHLAVSSDGTTARFFIDGQVQQEWDGSFSKRVDPHGFKIAFQQMVGNVAPSTIDNLRISNTARYTSNFTPATSFTSDSNTVALYRFNTGSGTTVSDNSSHGYTGILQGSPLPSWVAGE